MSGTPREHWSSGQSSGTACRRGAPSAPPLGGRWPWRHCTPGLLTYIRPIWRSSSARLIGLALGGRGSGRARNLRGRGIDPGRQMGKECHPRPIVGVVRELHHVLGIHLEDAAAGVLSLGYERIARCEIAGLVRGERTVDEGGGQVHERPDAWRQLAVEPAPVVQRPIVAVRITRLCRALRERERERDELDHEDTQRAVGATVRADRPVPRNCVHALSCGTGAGEHHCLGRVVRPRRVAEAAVPFGGRTWPGRRRRDAFTAEGPGRGPGN